MHERLAGLAAQLAATVTSCTVLMHATSAPNAAAIRISAAVSYVGPVPAHQRALVEVHARASPPPPAALRIAAAL